MDLGQLVPDAVTCDLVGSRLGEADAVGGVLLDGFPRSVMQADWLVRWFVDHGRGMDAVVSLSVPDALLIERISGRRTCAKCGATWHVTANPPPGGICGACGSPEIVQRKDDAEEVVRDRLVTYERETAPVLDVLRRASTVHDVDGVGTIDEIRTRIFAALRLG
jgi:adenylate kinase